MGYNLKKISPARELGKKLKREKKKGGKLHKKGGKGLKNASFWVREKNLKGERIKGGKLHKKGEKALKMNLFGLIRRGKMNLKRGWEMFEMHNIYPCLILQ